MQTCICTCYEGNNGKICKRQAAIIKLFYIDSAVNVLSNETKRRLYFIATGKEANVNLLEPLLVENVKNVYNVRNTENEISSESDHVYCEIDNEINSDDQPIQLGIPSDQNVLDVIAKWKDFSETILKNLDDDTAPFYPAVKIFLENRNKYAQSSESLLSGLYTAFKYSGNYSVNYLVTYFIKTFSKYL